MLYPMPYGNLVYISDFYLIGCVGSHWSGGQVFFIMILQQCFVRLGDTLFLLVYGEGLLFFACAPFTFLLHKPAGCQAVFGFSSGH